MKTLEERMGSLEGLKKLRAVNKDLDDAAKAREQGAGLDVLQQLKAKLENTAKQLKARTAPTLEAFSDLSDDSGIKTGLGAKVDSKVNDLKANMATFLSGIHQRDGAQSEAVVEGIQAKIQEMKKNSKANYERFDTAYDELEKKRAVENDKWFEDRARINREHKEAVERMDSEREEARARRQAEREEAFAEAEKDTEAFDAQFDEWRQASAAREEELRRRHEAETQRTQEDRKRREEEYQNLFAESKRKANEAESEMSKKARAADEAKRHRESAHARVVEEEERLRGLRFESKAKKQEAEDLEWDRIEAEARRKAEEAKEELKQAREKERRANEDRDDAERRRRDSFRYSRPSSSGGASHRPTAQEREEVRAYEEKHGNLEQAWCKFERRAKSDAFILTFKEVPFLTVGLLYRQLTTFKERQGNFKKLAKRWHPDKFLQRFSGQMAKREEEAIMLGVKESFQVVQEHCQK